MFPFIGGRRHHCDRPLVAVHNERLCRCIIDIFMWEAKRLHLLSKHVILFLQCLILPDESNHRIIRHGWTITIEGHIEFRSVSNQFLVKRGSTSWYSAIYIQWESSHRLLKNSWMHTTNKIMIKETFTRSGFCYKRIFNWMIYEMRKELGRTYLSLKLGCGFMHQLVLRARGYVTT